MYVKINKIILGLGVAAMPLMLHAGKASEKNKSFSPENNVKLGAAYFSPSSLPMYGTCIKPMPKVVDKLNKITQFEETIDSSSIAKTLNLSLEAKAGWGKFSSGAALKYLDRIQGDSYSIGAHYQSVISGEVTIDNTEFDGVAALTDGAARTYNADPEKFLERCGDSFIASIPMGAILDVSILIRFNSELQKEHFNTAFSGKIGGIFKGSAELKKEIEKNHYSGSIEVIAYQAGGSPQYLDNIFGSDSQNAFLHCDFSNLDACTKAMDNIIEYAQAKGPWVENGFAKQVNVVDGQLVADSLYPLNLEGAEIVRYEKAFHLDMPKAVSSPEIIQARETIEDLYDKNISRQGFISALLKSNAFKYLGLAIKNDIKLQARSIQKNMEAFRSRKVMSCYFPSEQDNCPEVLESLKTSLIPVSTQKFDLLEGAYFFNIDSRWPTIFVRLNGNSMQMYSVDLVPVTANMHSLNLIPSSDLSYIAPCGGYSYTTDGRYVRYYLDWYGKEDFVHRAPGGTSYLSTIPWYTCVNNRCFSDPHTIEIIPF